MPAVNQRFALSLPALVSELSKQSFSIVSCPILACSAFTTAPWSRDDDLPKTPAALSVRCRFQVVIRVGWTSQCCQFAESLLTDNGFQSHPRFEGR